MKDAITERLAQFIEVKGLSVRAFERELGLSVGVVAKAIKNGTAFSHHHIATIASVFPELDMEWLIKGKGQMLTKEEVLPALPEAQLLTEEYVKELIQKGIEEALKLQRA